MIKDTREIIERLRPTLGERSDRVWALYLSSDRDEQRELETTLRLLDLKRPTLSLRERPHCHVLAPLEAESRPGQIPTKLPLVLCITGLFQRIHVRPKNMAPFSSRFPN